MNRTVTTIIDPQLCIGCGACVKVCPSDTISLLGGKAVLTGAWGATAYFTVRRP
jgi:ferredoxin